MTSAFRGVRLRIASHAPTSIFRQPKRFQTCLHALATQSARAVDKIFRPVEGVGNAGCPLHPRSRVHLVVVERTRVTTSTPESPGIPARNGFNGLCRSAKASLVRVLLIAHKPFDQSCDPIARKTLPRPPHPAPTSVTIAKRPSVWDGMAKVLDVIWGVRKQEYFCTEDWTAQIRLKSHNKFGRARKRRSAVPRWGAAKSGVGSRRHSACGYPSPTPKSELRSSRPRKGGGSPRHTQTR